MKDRIKIATIVGARPQFIKASAISRAIQKNNAHSGNVFIEEVLIHTGQHYDNNMSQIFFDELEITVPAFNLGIGSGLHGSQTGKMLEAIETKLNEVLPDICIVYGDTNSTLAGALAAAKMHIPVGHVEAGLRSFNRAMPEEINRVLVDHISDMLFCPTENAVCKLSDEGISQGVYNVGDVMIDCLKYYTEKAKCFEQTLLSELKLNSGQYYLATVHRAENTDCSANLEEIFDGLNEIGRDDCPVILPLHPRTKNYLKEYGINISGNLRLIEPVSYMKMLLLEKNAGMILTDSGGMQKEAYHFSVPCVTLRRETEWVETVDCGMNRLSGPNKDRIIECVREFSERPIQQHNQAVYGGGCAAERVIDIILKFFKEKPKC